MEPMKLSWPNKGYGITAAHLIKSILTKLSMEHVRLPVNHSEFSSGICLGKLTDNILSPTRN